MELSKVKEAIPEVIEKIEELVSIINNTHLEADWFFLISLMPQ